MASMDTSAFFQQLAMLVKSGLPLNQGLTHLIKSQPKSLKKLTQAIAADLSEGKSLSQACRAHHQGRFSTSQLACIEAAEDSGQLEPMLEALAKEESFDSQLAQKIKSRLVYPVLLIHLAALIPAFITLSQQSLIFALLEVILWLSPFYLGAFALYFFTRSGQLDAVYLKVPFVGSTIKNTDASRFYRTLATLLKAGARVENAWLAACNATTNRHLTQVLKDQLPHLQAGEPFSDLMLRSRIFPASTVNLLAAGELSGNLTQTLSQLAELLRFDAEQSAGRMALALAACLYVLAVGMIILRILSVLGPVFETLNQLSAA